MAVVIRSVIYKNADSAKAVFHLRKSASQCGNICQIAAEEQRRVGALIFEPVY
jgi:hypothetical protein